MTTTCLARPSSIRLLLLGVLVALVETACPGTAANREKLKLPDERTTREIVVSEPREPDLAPVDRTPTRPSISAEEMNRKARESGLLGDVFFAFDRSSLSEASRSRLFKNARYLREKRQAVVMIEGHCDERGTDEYNLALGDQRASVTADYLIRLGVEHERIRIVSFGEERSFCKEATESCWGLNRRAHFRIIEIRSANRAAWRQGR